jgi:hypothetical protein
VLRRGPLPYLPEPHLPFPGPSIDESVPSILISPHPSNDRSSILISCHRSIDGPSILILRHPSIDSPYILILRRRSIYGPSILILRRRFLYDPYILISRCRFLFRAIDRSMAHLFLFWAIYSYFELSILILGRPRVGRAGAGTFLRVQNAAEGMRKPAPFASGGRLPVLRHDKGLAGTATCRP